MCIVAQSCPTLCDPMDCSPLAPLSIGILQARILEWVAMASSRGSSQPGDQIQVSRAAGRLLTVWATREIKQYITFEFQKILIIFQRSWMSLHYYSLVEFHISWQYHLQSMRLAITYILAYIHHCLFLIFHVFTHLFHILYHSVACAVLFHCNYSLDFSDD